MQQHCAIGNGILKGSNSDLLQLAALIALTHHERFDGAGYPSRLQGKAIPIEGRIAAIADTFDALTSDRVYRKAMDLDAVMRIMQQGRGTAFDPELLDVFMAAMPAVLKIRDERATVVAA